MHSAIISSGLRYRAMPLAGQLVHKWVRSSRSSRTRDNSPQVSPAPTPDRDRTVSRRSEPSSRTALIGEQPNPWDLLQPQDAMSRHRGAKPKRRCELFGLDQPGYPRRTFYPLSDGPSTRNHRITRPSFRSCSTCVSRRQPGLCSCTLHGGFPIRLSRALGASVTIWEATAPVKLPVWPCPPTRLRVVS